MFYCRKCGLCCTKVCSSPIYEFLDRGDGCCKYYDADTKLCKIYDNRPIICNVDEMYDRYFCKYMTREEYYKLNYEACKKLASS